MEAGPRLSHHAAQMETDSELVLVVDGGARRFPSDNFVVGTAETCALKLAKGRCDPRHAQMWKAKSGAWWIRALGASTLEVSGAVREKVRLDHGTRVRLGKAELEVRPATEQSESRTLVATPKRGEVITKPGVVLQEGHIISDRYRVVTHIAGGGMGDVFRVEHLELGKTFALKVLKPEHSDDEDFVSRFRREAFAASRLGHEHIVEVTDSGKTESGQHYFVMEDLKGETLAEHLHRGPFPAKRAARVAMQVASAIEAAHSEGVIHRDLKPSNIMLLQRPRRPDFVKVLDFGAAKVLTGTGALAQTAVGTVVGTPEYMSPEQASGLPVDERSDLYALGLVIYEMLTATTAFEAPTPTAVLVKQLTKAPPPMDGSLRIPAGLNDLVMRLLSKKVIQRPQTAGEVVELLEPFSA